MEIYIFFILVIFFFSLIEVFNAKSVLKKQLLWIVYILSVVIVGLRWETGTDWNPYIGTFEVANKSFSYLLESTSGMELGYLSLVYLVRSFTDEYVVFLFVHALIYYYCILFGLRKITAYPITAYLYLFASTLGVLGSNRQLFAVGLIFYTITWAIAKNKKFFLVVLSAFMFHTTALITAVYYFLNRRFTVLLISVVLLLALVIGLSPLPLKIFSFAGGLNEHTLSKVDAYLSGDSETLSVAGIFKRVLYVVLFLFIRNKVEKKYLNYNFFLNGYLISIVLYLMFSNFLTIVVNRGSLYFNILEGILLNAPFYIIKKVEAKFMYIIFLLALSILMMYQSISAYPDLFDPYKSIWYNYDYFRRMY